MPTKTLRMFLCTGVAVVLGTLATASHATLFDVGFDPPFSAPGNMRIDVPVSCLSPNTIHGCMFDVLSLDFFDSLNREWNILGPRPGIGTSVSIVAGTLAAIAVSIPNLHLVTDTSGCNGEGSPTLIFSIQAPTLTTVTFQCPGRADDTGVVTSIRQVGLVPEPATLALLCLGLIGLAASRRRRTH